MLPVKKFVMVPQEPVVTPLWSTFLNSTSGVWKGVAASFSPLTGDFEPLGMNSQKKYLFHADTEVAAISSKEATMVRKTTLRPRSLEAESKDSDIGLYVVPDEDGVRKEISESNSDVTLDESPLQNEGSSLSILPDDDISGSDADESEEDFEFQEEDDEVSDISSSKAEETSDDSLLTVIDEEEMKCEPGLVYFEVRISRFSSNNFSYFNVDENVTISIDFRMVLIHLDRLIFCQLKKKALLLEMEPQMMFIFPLLFSYSSR